MTAGTIRRLLVVDPVRHDRRGHHWHFAEGVLREARRHGFAARFFVARSAAGRAMPAPDMHPVIRHGLYRPVTGARDESIETDYELGSAAMRDDLMACAAFDPGPGDLILVPSASLRSVGALAAWRAATGNPAPVAFLFHDILPEGATLEAGMPARDVAGRAGAALRATAGPALIGATNAALAAALSDAFGLGVTVLPLPHWYDLDPPASAAVVPAADGAPSVVFLGELRRNKGGDMLADVALRLRAAGRRLRFVAQAGHADPGLVTALRPVARDGAIRLLERHLTNAEFARLIEDASVLLLPYERALYRARISGPFAFAAAAGRPCIVPDGTWMAEQIEAGRAAGIAYRGDGAATVADAVIAALDDLPGLTQRAGTLAAAWRADNGGKLVRQLLSWSQQA